MALSVTPSGVPPRPGSAANADRLRHQIGPDSEGRGGHSECAVCAPVFPSSVCRRHGDGTRAPPTPNLTIPLSTGVRASTAGGWDRHRGTHSLSWHHRRVTVCRCGWDICWRGFCPRSTEQPALPPGCRSVRIIRLPWSALHAFCEVWTCSVSCFSPHSLEGAISVNTEGLLSNPSAALRLVPETPCAGHSASFV